MASSRSPYGERGLKCNEASPEYQRRSRSPYGERGLKLDWHGVYRQRGESLSLRRAWIEIKGLIVGDLWLKSLSLRRAWIEISNRQPWNGHHGGRSPYGERGLKYRFILRNAHFASSSLSLRRAWIEIRVTESYAAPMSRSPYGERGLK